MEGWCPIDSFIGVKRFRALLIVLRVLERYPWLYMSTEKSQIMGIVTVNGCLLFATQEENLAQYLVSLMGVSTHAVDESDIRLTESPSWRQARRKCSTPLAGIRGVWDRSLLVLMLGEEQDP